MTYLRLLLTIILSLLLPLVLGTGAIFLFEKKFDIKKAFFIGYLMQMASIFFLIRLTIHRGWSNNKIVLAWLVLLALGVLAVAAIIFWRSRWIKDISVRDLPFWNPKWWGKMALITLVLFAGNGLLRFAISGDAANTVIATARHIYVNGSPAALDFDPYSGAYTGILTAGTYDKKEIYMACYYAILSAMAGVQPTFVVRFVASALTLLEAGLGLSLLIDYFWPQDKRPQGWGFLAFVIVQLAILVSNRGEMMQLLAMTWSRQVAWIYILVPGFLYAFLTMQEKLFAIEGQGKKKAISLCFVLAEIVFWMLLFLLCGSVWARNTRLLLEIWLVLFVACWWIRRYLFRD